MAFECAAFFNQLDMFSIRLGLESTRELARLAGDPQKQLKFIHIAGTNGKGSTGAMLERTLRAAGYTTGFYTSPHLIDIRERFRINGKTVDAETFEFRGEQLAAIAGTRFSYFEFATILALLIFKAAKCDVVIWETGLGGRLCATNIVDPELCIITNIALDHMDHLGDNTAKIAAEKAGIIKVGIPVICGKLPADAEAVIRTRAAEKNARYIPCRAEVPDSAKIISDNGFPLQRFIYDGREITLALPGKMQRENFRIVYEALELLSKKWDFSFEKSLDALKLVRWPGRFQQITERIILDGGHNPDGTAALAEALNELYPGEKFTTVYAAFADKNAGECVRNLSQFTGQFFFTSPGSWSRKSFAPGELIAFAAEYGVGADGCADPLEAVKMALECSERRVIISGSLYLAGEILQNYLPLSATLDI